MDKAECEHCAYAAPKDTDEVARKSINEWKWPDDWDCPFEHEDFPDCAHLCVDFSDVRKVEVLTG